MPSDEHGRRVPRWMRRIAQGMWRSYRPVVFTLIAFQGLATLFGGLVAVLWIGHGTTTLPWVMLPYAKLNVIYGSMAAGLIVAAHFYRHGVFKSITMFIVWINENLGTELPEDNHAQ